jgi:hypothetical protein
LRKYLFVFGLLSLEEKAVMLKRFSMMFILAALCFIPLTATSQNVPAAGPLFLKGNLTRPTGPFGQQREPAADAIVSFVSFRGDTPIERVYTTICSTVSDDSGDYELILDWVDPAAKYAIRARAPGDVWTTFDLGTGSQQQQWLKPTDLTLGQSLSILLQIEQEEGQAQQNLNMLQQQESDLRRRDAMLRAQMNALQGQRFPPASQGQIQQLQGQIASNAAIWARNTPRLQAATMYVQTVFRYQQQQEQVAQQTGFGTTIRRFSLRLIAESTKSQTPWK